MKSEENRKMNKQKSNLIIQKHVPFSDVYAVVEITEIEKIRILFTGSRNECLKYKAELNYKRSNI